MIVRLDFGRGAQRARTLRLGPDPGDGVQIFAQLSPHLPFKDNSVDEIFIERAFADVEDVVCIMEEFWRMSKPGTIIHLRLPHASSSWGLSRDPRHRQHFTLETFNYFDPRRNENFDCKSLASFHVEYTRLYLTAPRSGARGLALGRGVVTQVVEAFVNQNRGMQYRWERWLAALLGGFEEFYVVLSAVKEPSYG